MVHQLPERSLDTLDIQPSMGISNVTKKADVSVAAAKLLPSPSCEGELRFDVPQESRHLDDAVG